MNRLSAILLFLALPAMLLPHRISLCVCQECACCAVEEVERPSCCSGKPMVPQDSIKSCEQLELENPAPEADCPQMVSLVLPEAHAAPLPVRLAQALPNSRPEPPAVATPPPIRTPILI